MYTTSEPMTVLDRYTVDSEAQQVKKQIKYNLAQAQRLIAELGFIDQSYSIVARCLLLYPHLKDILDIKIHQVDKERSGIHYNNGATFTSYPACFIDEVYQYIFDGQIAREGSDNVFFTPQGRQMLAPNVSRTMSMACDRMGLDDQPTPRDFRNMWIDIWSELCDKDKRSRIGLADRIYGLLGKENPFLRILSPIYIPIDGVSSSLNDDMSLAYDAMNKVGSCIRPVLLESLYGGWLSWVTNQKSIDFYPGYWDEFRDVGGIVSKEPNGITYTVGEFADLDWKAVETFIKTYTMWRGTGEKKNESRLYCFKNLRSYLNEITFGWFIRTSKIKEQ